MPRWIAFLRAINVGGHTVKMETLRALHETLGFSQVETFIASGNVIFESPEEQAGVLERKIEVQLRGSLGYEVATFVRSAGELAALAAYDPFPSAGTESGLNNLYIGFLKQAPEAAALEKLMAYRTPLNDFHLHRREIYWLCRTRMSDSTFSGALLEKALGMPTTLRNSTTIQKLAAKYAAPE